MSDQRPLSRNQPACREDRGSSALAAWLVPGLFLFVFWSLFLPSEASAAVLPPAPTITIDGQIPRSTPSPKASGPTSARKATDPDDRSAVTPAPSESYDSSPSSTASETATEKPVVRPTLSGFHSWKYNRFSSYDQVRLNLEREFAKGQKFMVSANGLRYQEKDNKSWDMYVGETYYKFKKDKFDIRIGQLVETLGSGDKVSFVDKLNSRRYHAGLANDYNRDKMEQPALKTTYYFTKRQSLDLHYLPMFRAGDLPSIYSRWASAYQKDLAYNVLLGATYLTEKKDSLSPQYHVAYNTSFPKYEIRYHYFWFKDRLPIIDRPTETLFRQTYPKDETIAIDGNVTLSKDFLIRYEFAYTRDKSYSTFTSNRIGRSFRSDTYNLLLGTDKTYRNKLYLNVQGLMSSMATMPARTPFQLAPTELGATLQVRKGFYSERLFIEFNGVSNFSTGEYLLTPNFSYQSSDYFKFTSGVHLNGKSSYALGPIGQFDQNNTFFLETMITF